MTIIGDALDAARQLARQISDSSETTIPAPEITRLNEQIAAPEQLAEIMTTLQQDALKRLDPSPREALGLARVAHELADVRAGERARSETALTLAIVLNRLGEFSEALKLAERTASFFAPRGEEENFARALCEAAWAQTFIGNLSEAIAEIERARAATSSSLIHARCDWIQARVLRDQSHYPEAAELFEKARDAFQAAQLPLEAARCEREIAYAYIRSERREAFPLLENVRQTFEAAECALDVALCDYLLAIALWEATRYADALQPLLLSQRKFTDVKASFFVAWCYLDLGNVYRYLNRFPESLQSSQQARDYFLSHSFHVLVSTCDINLGNTYYSLNRYDDALVLYQQAADLSLSDGRETRLARIYNNMGLVYAKQGLFAKSIDLYQRALKICASKNLPLFQASIRTSLASCYRQLGQFNEALPYLQQAKEMFAHHQRRDSFVQCNIVLAQIHMAGGKIAEAVACLEQARGIAVADGFDSVVAVCDRLLAQTMRDREQALAWVESSRSFFLKHTQPVDAALCDLTEGELRLQWNEFDAARDYFRRARSILSPAFPDQAWRAEYGLGRCAAASGDNAAALDHYLSAIRTIAASRSMLVTEQLSNDFYAHRQSVFDEALSIALKQDARELALEVIEASKARTFLTLLQQRGWKAREGRQDPYIADLVTRERNLRQELNALRSRVAFQAPTDGGQPLRGGSELAAVSAAALQELNALSQQYESVVAQLRLATTGLVGVSAPASFALDPFRAAANAAFGKDWAALDYYLTEESLTILVVYPDRLEAVIKKLSPFDRNILDQCAGTEADLRELIYRGTLRGDPMPFPREKYLSHLHDLLIPQDLTAATLIIAPHGALHALPFHALIAPRGENYLIERHTCIYTPSLQVSQHLLSQSSDRVVSQPLVFGISKFGDELQPIPFAPAEVDLVSQVFNGCGEYLRESQATRQRLFELNTSGELLNFDLLHFATHAMLDGTSPHQSRVLLHDEALTAMDILDLSLNARLVMLSACQTALGKGGRGDEMLGLARAFFYAGANSVLATLWSVEDRSTLELIGRFYRHWIGGRNAAEALRRTQSEMIREGYSAFQWAPFMLIGHA